MALPERILRVNELLRQHLNQIILTEIDFPEGCLVTIIAVETSKDLRYAKFFVGVIPDEKTGKVLEILNKNIGHLQHLLNKKLSIKPLPRISFVLDETERKASDSERLLDRIKGEAG